MAVITKSIEIKAPVEVVFDYVANPHNTVKYSPQFSKFVPIGPKERGLGAKVEATGSIKGMNIKTTLEIVEFVENEKFVSRSLDGVKSTSVWRFKPTSSGNTEVIFTSDYTMPGSKIGWLLDKMLIEKDIERMTIESLVNLKKLIEGNPNIRAKS